MYMWLKTGTEAQNTEVINTTYKWQMAINIGVLNSIRDIV